MPGDAPWTCDSRAEDRQRIVNPGSMRRQPATRALDIFVPQVTAHGPQERLNVPVTVDSPKPREKHRLRRGLRQRRHRCLPRQHRRLIGQLRRIFRLSGQLGASGAHGSHSSQWKYLPICHGREQPVRQRPAMPARFQRQHFQLQPDVYVVNESASTVSVCTVGTNGAPTSCPTSPLPAGTYDANSVVFNGSQACVDDNAGNLWLCSVNSTSGALTSCAQGKGSNSFSTSQQLAIH
jgi:hypothetical protein